MKSTVPIVRARRCDVSSLERGARHAGAVVGRPGGARAAAVGMWRSSAGTAGGGRVAEVRWHGVLVARRWRVSRRCGGGSGWAGASGSGAERVRGWAFRTLGYCYPYDILAAYSAPWSSNSARVQHRRTGAVWHYARILHATILLGRVRGRLAPGGSAVRPAPTVSQARHDDGVLDIVYARTPGFPTDPPKAHNIAGGPSTPRRSTVRVHLPSIRDRQRPTRPERPPSEGRALVKLAWCSPLVRLRGVERPHADAQRRPPPSPSSPRSRGNAIVGVQHS